MTNEKKLWDCTVCAGQYPLEGGLLAEHRNGAAECLGSRRMPGSVHPFFGGEPSHAAVDSFGVHRGCRCSIGEDHDEPMAPELAHLFQFSPERITEGRAFVAGPSRVGDSDKKITESLSSMTSSHYAVFSKTLNDDLKDVVRRAIQLAEENPRNEAMRTPIARPAVERMLAEDLDTTMTGLNMTMQQRAEVAKALFDAGWRPTIERLAR